MSVSLFNVLDQINVFVSSWVYVCACVCIHLSNASVCMMN